MARYWYSLTINGMEIDSTEDGLTKAKILAKRLARQYNRTVKVYQIPIIGKGKQLVGEAQVGGN